MSIPKKEMTAKKERHLSVWVSPDQLDMLTRAAAAEDEDKPSRWLRKIGLKRAREVLSDSVAAEKPRGRR